MNKKYPDRGLSKPVRKLSECFSNSDIFRNQTDQERKDALDPGLGKPVRKLSECFSIIEHIRVMFEGEGPNSKTTVRFSPKKE